jgi:hypothetical protein
MSFEVSRLRSGEWIASGGALALLIVLFVAPWYGLTGAAKRAAQLAGQETTINGYNEYTHLRWLILLTIAVALALVILQATRRAPALPVSFSVFVTVLGGLTSLWLIYRVLISVPSGGGELDQMFGAYVGLASALVLTYGGYRSMREETHPDSERNAAIETVHIDRPA